MRSDDIQTKLKTIPPPPPLPQPLCLCDTLEDNIIDTSTPSSSCKYVSHHYSKFSTFHFPLLSAVTTTYKTTHSNVMCVTNSGLWTKIDRDDRRSHPTKGVRRMDRTPSYKSIYSKEGKNQHRHRYRNGQQKTFTTQGKRDKESTPSSLQQTKVDRELHKEHRLFMANLQRQRKDKFERENCAATRIQSFLRGIHVRQSIFPDRYGGSTGGIFAGYYRNSDPPSEDKIWQVMLDAATKLGIQPDEEMLLGFKMPAQFQHYMVQSDNHMQKSNPRRSGFHSK